MHKTTEELRALEANAEYLGLSKLQMMENAGLSLADEIMKRFKKPANVVIFCGVSGNGGDGFVAARHLAGQGYHVKVLVFGEDRDIVADEVRANWEILKSMDKTIDLQLIGEHSEILLAPSPEIVVDAMVGLGIRGVLRANLKKAVDAVNACKGFKVAVDVPSGIEPDTGQVMGVAVKADLTVSFHSAKNGFQAAKEYVGELVVRRVGIPEEAEAYAGPGDVELATIRRKADAHKGECGRVLVVGGSELYSGAPALSALGAYRAGVDLVYIACPEPVANAIAGFSPSLIVSRLDGPFLSGKNMTTIQQLLGRSDSLIIGPGLGTREETSEAVRSIIEMTEEVGVPIVIDADAIKVFARWKRKLRCGAILTPHRGEFETLSNRSLPSDPRLVPEAVRSEAEKTDATVLLKGRVDIISDGVHVKLNRTGNAGMTVGGTGDVLAGVAAAYLAKGVAPFRAGVAAAFVNGAAGDLAARERGYHLLPTDLLEHLPQAMDNPMGHRPIAREKWTKREEGKDHRIFLSSSFT